MKKKFKNPCREKIGGGGWGGKWSQVSWSIFVPGSTFWSDDAKNAMIQAETSCWNTFPPYSLPRYCSSKSNPVWGSISDLTDPYISVEDCCTEVSQTSWIQNNYKKLALSAVSRRTRPTTQDARLACKAAVQSTRLSRVSRGWSCIRLASAIAGADDIFLF